MKNLFTIIIIISFLTLANTQSSFQPSIQPIETAEQTAIATWMDSIITSWMDSVEIPGVIVSVVRGDSLIHKAGYGYIDLEQTKVVNPDQTIFRIASISKVITAISALIQVNENRLDLNADIEKYLDFKIRKIPGENITLHNLLTHTSGFDEVLIGANTKYRTEVAELGQFLASNMSPQVRPSGEAFSYSNIGYDLIGHLAELAADQPLHEYARQAIFQPLNMEKTSYLRSEKTDLHESKSYVFDNGNLEEVPPIEIRGYPSGSVLSTADDMSRFMIMLLNQCSFEYNQILKPEVCSTLSKSIYSNDPIFKGSRSYGFFNLEINGISYLTHGGSIEGFRSQLTLFPEQKIGLFISANSTWGGWSNADIGNQFRKRWFYSSEEKVEPAKPIGQPERASDIEGNYYTTRSPQSGILKIGRITRDMIEIEFDDEGYLLIEGDTANKYAQTSPLKFSTSTDRGDVNSPILFKEGEDGRIHYLFTSGFNSFYKLKWWETNSAQMCFVVTIFIILLFGLLSQFVISRKPGSPTKMASKGYKRMNKMVASAAALHLLTFLIIGFYLYLSDGDAFDFGMPFFLQILLWGPLVSVVLTVIAVFGFRKVWSENYATVFNKVCYTMVVAALVLMIPFLTYWNMLGFNY